MGADDEPLTLRQASAKVEDAIDYGAIAEQQAPAGHAIFAAVDAARATKSSIDDQIPWFSADAPASAAVAQQADQAVSAIFDAAATLRVSADQPLPTTQYSTAAAFPWAWIGAGVAAIAGVGLLYRRAA